MIESEGRMDRLRRKKEIVIVFLSGAAPQKNQLISF
jgi:hypothetical protein